MISSVECSRRLSAVFLFVCFFVHRIMKHYFIRLLRTLLMAWQRAKSPLDDVTSTVPRNLMVNFQCSSSPSVHVNVI